MCHRQKMKKKYIKVTINNEDDTLDEGTSVRRMLEERDIKSRASVWVNGEQLLLSEYDTYIIHENDRIKILRIVAGG